MDNVSEIDQSETEQTNVTAKENTTPETKLEDRSTSGGLRRSQRTIKAPEKLNLSLQLEKGEIKELITKEIFV